MRKRKRGLTQRQLMTYLARVAPTAYQCHTSLCSGGRWIPECTVIVDGWPIAALDIRETFPSHGAALSAAYAAACERERRLWRWFDRELTRPIGVN